MNGLGYQYLLPFLTPLKVPTSPIWQPPHLAKRHVKKAQQTAPFNTLHQYPKLPTELKRIILACAIAAIGPRDVTFTLDELSGIVDWVGTDLHLGHRLVSTTPVPPLLQVDHETRMLVLETHKVIHDKSGKALPLGPRTPVRGLFKFDQPLLSSPWICYELENLVHFANPQDLAKIKRIRVTRSPFLLERGYLSEKIFPSAGGLEKLTMDAEAWHGVHDVGSTTRNQVQRSFRTEVGKMKEENRDWKEPKFEISKLLDSAEEGRFASSDWSFGDVIRL